MSNQKLITTAKFAENQKSLNELLTIMIEITNILHCQEIPILKFEFGIHQSDVKVAKTPKDVKLWAGSISFSAKSILGPWKHTGPYTPKKSQEDERYLISSAIGKANTAKVFMKQ